MDVVGPHMAILHERLKICARKRFSDVEIQLMQVLAFVPWGWVFFPHLSSICCECEQR